MSKQGRPFDKCFIDADSLIFRIALKTDLSLKKAKEHYDKAIEDIQWDTCAEEVMVALKGEGNFRYDIAEDYKGNRSKPMEDAVIKRRKQLNKYAYSLGHHKSDGCEADDVVSIWAQEALDANVNFVIAHIDKDIDMVEGWHWNFTKKELYYMDELEAWRHMCVQMLTGDKSVDNIQGLHGIGPKKAEKILLNLPKDGMIVAVKEAWENHHPKEDWLAMLTICWNLIYMRRGWDDFRKLELDEVFV